MISIEMAILAVFVSLFIIIYFFLGARFIRSDKVGIVEKLWSGKGSQKDSIIALHEEAGFQPEILRGGIHFKTRFMYRIHKMPWVTIPQGQIGYVFARDGVPLPPEQTLGRLVPSNYQDVRSFMESSGQKGPQRGILREGTYALNLAQFIIITASGIHYLPIGDKNERAMIEEMADHVNEVDGFRPIVIKDSDDMTGIVTVHDGPSLSSGDIIAPTVGDNPDRPDNYHNNFQNPETFLAAGGFRGRQYQVLTEGTYFINRLFATVELIEKTTIPIGFAGVVVSYIGPKGEDTSGEDYRHGELVANGYRGVWQTPLMPGKYAFNTYAGKIVQVPTTNIILKWIRNEMGDHKYDANLAEVGLITKDAFEPLLPLSVVIHIDYMKAPLVIQRFGDIQKLVEQTLDPMVSAYFKNVGQTMTLIELIQKRNEIQAHAGEQMKAKFAHYNLELEEVLIGTPHSQDKDEKIETILTQLRDRQIATEKLETFRRQQAAAEQEKDLKQAQAAAQQQTALTESAIDITVQENQGKASLAKAKQEADRTVALARANATQVMLLAEAEAEKAARVGIGEAMAIEEKVKAYGGPQAQVVSTVMSKFADAVQATGVELVPRTVVNMGGHDGDAGANALTLLLTTLTAEKLGVDLASAAKEAAPERAKKVSGIKEKIIDAMNKDVAPNQEERPRKK